MKPLPLLSALALGMIAPSSQASEAQQEEAPSQRAAASAFEIEWIYSSLGFEKDRSPSLRFVQGDRRITMGWKAIPGGIERVAAASRINPGGEVSFGLAREAGALTCTGVARSADYASGSCLVAPADGFRAALIERGVDTGGERELLSLVLVDARLELLDGLTEAGIRIADAAELAAAASVGLSPGYVAELRNAGLPIQDVRRLAAARAVGLDAAWLETMAGAGYPDLTLRQAIRMRSAEVKPEAARRTDGEANARGEGR